MLMKTWFITGTSAGFGRLLTEKLLARGERVAATLRKPEALADLKAQYGEQLWVAALDVTDTATVRRIVDQAFADLGRIDVVVNNAAYALFGAGEEATDDQIRQQLDTNLIGSIQVIRAVLPHLRAQGGGRILQLSSEGGQIAYPNFGYYHATKWGIEGYVEAVAQEVAPFGIEFTLVEPGPARTNFGGGLVHATPLPAYEATPAGDVRRGVSDGSFAVTGDPEKMVDAMLASVDQRPAPRRLTLGRGAYTKIRAALVQRLAELDAQQAVAFSTEAED
jgi:NAD(P)-dependent dehydrogenase (short-subunit alcohol dehydrogenase family)